MSFSIETYDRKRLEGLTRLYNTETAFEGQIAPLDPDRFIHLVEKKSAFDPNGLFIAIESGQVVGWVHACVAAGSEGSHDPRNRLPRIRMLIFPRQRLRVGGALVAEATAWLRRTGRREIEALHAHAGYPFYRGLWLGGEPMTHAGMPHVQIALDVAGYKNTQESVFMVAEMRSPPQATETAVPLELVESPVEMKHEPMRESWLGFEPMRIQALVGGEEAGSIGWVMLPHLADRLGAPGMNIWSLGVRDRFRRQGIGTALVARAMAHGCARGARTASLGTQLWNAPAHATYSRLVFVPHCLLIGRTLITPPGGES